jgi:hypothetical protein
MAVTGTIAAASTIGSAIIGNQQKQKAKGQAGQIERDAQAAQDAADKKAQQLHDQNLLAQSQAGAVARASLEATPKRSSTLISPDLQTPTATARTLSATGATPLPAPIAPIQRKTLLGQ